jgi:hypothetical protein
MSLDYQQVREQVLQLGERAPARQQELKSKRATARAQLTSMACETEPLRQKVELVARLHDPALRCALPVFKPDGTAEALDGEFPLPDLPENATILAADGSQINLDRHAEVEYSLVNVGTIQMELASPAPPRAIVRSELFFDEMLYNMTEQSLALIRDLKERTLLAELASQATQPVIALTDGPMELWGAKDATSDEASAFQRSLDQYLEVLSQLAAQHTVAAGYVDKPAANLVVRLLEVAMAPRENLEHIRRFRPLQGVTDRDLYYPLLSPGARSAVFAMQSQSARNYKDRLALHFFYLNIGGPKRSGLARVEIPAWVAQDPALLDALHAVLVEQCRVMGTRPYPYLLHRAHETARVSLEEKEQVTQMIALELRRRGVPIEGQSFKQSNKDLQGRTRL